MPNSHCVVLMPFGRKTDAYGSVIDFDAVYQELIAPSAAAAGLQTLRADDFTLSGAPLERLISADYAIVDVTTGDASVMYELGIRHASRRKITIVLCAEKTRVPFDVAALRAISYGLDAGGRPADARRVLAQIIDVLRRSSESSIDSPVFASIPMMTEQQVGDPSLAVDADRVAAMEKRLTEAAGRGLSALQEIETEVFSLALVEPVLLLQLFIAYRYHAAWQEMIRIAEQMPAAVKNTVPVQEQLALALNRVGHSDRAESVLHGLLSTHGPSGQTFAILGRVYKDRWETAVRSGDAYLAQPMLQKAVDAYLNAVEADPSDVYSGLNAVTLIELIEPRSPELSQKQRTLIPVVSYFVRKRIGAKASYFEYAALLELAILGKDEEVAREALAGILLTRTATWEVESTLSNLGVIRAIRQFRNEEAGWEQSIVDELKRVA